MNLAYYVVLFDAATDVLFDQIGLGAAYRESEAASLFAVETHTVYRRELLAGAQVRIDAQVLGVGAKRLHVAHEMFDSDAACAATQKILFVHVSLRTRQSIVFSSPAALRLSSAVPKAGPPAWVGRRIIL